MVGIIVMSHGDMAEGMVTSSRLLRETARGLEALCLAPEQLPQDFDRELAEAVERVDEGDGVLLLADVNGGTPANRALLLAAKRPDIEVAAGVNLPLLLEALDMREYCALHEVYEQLMEAAPYSITFPSRQMREGQEDAGVPDGLDALME